MNIDFFNAVQFVSWAHLNVEFILLCAFSLPLALTVLSQTVLRERKREERPLEASVRSDRDRHDSVSPTSADQSEISIELPKREARESRAIPSDSKVASSTRNVGLEPKASSRKQLLYERLSLTREAIFGRIGSTLGSRHVDSSILEELEVLLFAADFGVKTAESLLRAVKERASNAGLEEVREVLREELSSRLQRVESPSIIEGRSASPHVILVLGVNGSGKTTTIGKLAFRFSELGNKVVLGAADTFRAAAVEQLQAWGKRANCAVVSGRDSGDPAAVAFDTVRSAVDGDFDIAIIDTAGRLQTKEPLMEQLGKIYRILGRDLAGAPHETLLVLDANTGQNAINQARLFSEVAPVTGLALTKLDGSAKGGVIVGLADEFQIPVKLIGVGEGIDDLRDFDSVEFVSALLGESP